MNRTTLARRYAPLAVVIAVQLLLVAVVPSTGSHGTAASTLNVGGGGGGSTDLGPGGDNGATAGTGTGGTGGSGGAVATAAGGATAAGVSTSGAGGGSNDSSNPAVAGDTSHCVNGREFDPAIAYWAPPCVAGTPGAVYRNNGGATYQGVSATQITIVDYITDYGAEVNQILKAEGLLETYDDAKILDKAFEKFINDHYVLYGRKVHIVPYQGTCQSVPPDYACLTQEMDHVVDSYKPYMVFWNTTLCSVCYAELERKQTIAVGGEGFSDDLANQLAPFFYSAGMSSTRMETMFAEFWCNQLSSQNNPSRTVKYALHNNPAQDFNGKPRRLGVISTNDKDNEDTVKNVLFKELASRCNEPTPNFYFYEQDINTAAKQVAAGIAALDDPNHPATSVICLCDPVAPQFLYNGEQQNNYFPENLLADVQNMGYDSTGQNYVGSVTCPNNAQGCEYDAAFGLVASSPDRSQGGGEGVKIFNAGGGVGAPPTTGLETSILAMNWIMMANLIENSGPNLNPRDMQAKAPAMGTTGGGNTGNATLGFKPGSWNWTMDARIVYFNKHKPSVYNNANGAYVNASPGRFGPGQFPVLPDVQNVPTADRRQ